MFEGALKGIALLALASITINTVKLLRHLPLLLLAIVVLGAAAWLMR